MVYFYHTNYHSSLRKPKNINLPEYLVYQVKTTIFGNNGQIEKKISAKKVAHFTETDIDIVQLPEVYLMKNPNEIWQICSRLAYTAKAKEQFYLKDNVQIKQYEKLNKNPLTYLTTTELYYFPKMEIAYTDKVVDIEQPQGHVHATGMRSFLNKNMIEFLSQVSVHYEMPN